MSTINFLDYRSSLTSVAYESDYIKELEKQLASPDLLNKYIADNNRTILVFRNREIWERHKHH